MMRYLMVFCVFALIALSGCHNLPVGSEEDEPGLNGNEHPPPLSYVLPAPASEGHISVEEALSERRSRRNFQDKAISAEQLSQILWAAYGISGENGLRTAPSAGALYPLEIYVAIGNVDGIDAGLYKYDAKGHKITQTINRNVREELNSAAANQDMIKDAPLTVVYTAVFDITSERYGERGRERYVYMEIGHSAQNIYLQAEALGLGACAVGAFSDDTISELFELQPDEAPLYLMPVGHVSP